MALEPLSPGSPYTRRDHRRAVNLAAMIGFAAFLAMTGTWLFFPVSVLLGMPVAFAACWLVGAPVLARLMRRKVGWASAALWGALIALVMSLAWLAFARWLGWRQSLNPTAWSQIGGGDYIQSIDGILTPYGWWVAAQGHAAFVLLGAAVALAVRAIIGPGRPRP